MASTRTARFGERVAVRREADAGVGPVDGNLVERVEEAGERVAVRTEAADVGRDRGQHVVAGQHHAVGRVEQAEVVLGVTGGVQRHPVAAGEADRPGVVEAHGRHREHAAGAGT